MEPDSIEERHEAEFVRLLTDHQSMIRAYVISLLPGAPGADDVIQEANTVLWRKRRDFRPGSDFCAWALTVARFQVMAHWKVLKQRRWVTLDEDVFETMADELEQEADPEFERRKVAALHQCLALLKEPERELILQRYWKMTRLKDFAAVSGRSMNGLKVTFFRLRASLKRCIDQKLQEAGGRL